VVSETLPDTRSPGGSCASSRARSSASRDTSRSLRGPRPLLNPRRQQYAATPPRRRGCTHSRGVADWLHVRPELDLWVALTPGGCQIGYMGDQNSTHGLSLHSRGVSLDWSHGTFRISSTGVLTHNNNVVKSGVPSPTMV
jgi:hypothetical protein